MKRFQIKMVRLMEPSSDHSVAELTVIVEDKTGDTLEEFATWAEHWAECILPGYHVSEIIELG